MASLDRQVFERLSEETEFQVDVLEKVYRLTELLREISRTDLGEKLVLKGGTAINFIYFDFPRLSVDLDLDYTGAIDKEQMLEERQKIGELLERVFNMLGYEPEERSSYALLQHNLFYENSAENRDRIQLEINFLKRVTFLQPVEVEFATPFDLPDFPVTTLKTEELFGRKAKALAARATPRDLYDIDRLLTSEIRIDREIMRKCFLFSLCLDGDPRQIGSASDILDQISPNDVKRNLLPMLRKGVRTDLEAMKGRVGPLLKQFLTFTPSERTFIERLFEEKDYRPQLLFEDVDFNEALANHPGIGWRLKSMD